LATSIIKDIVFLDSGLDVNYKIPAQYVKAFLILDLLFYFFITLSLFVLSLEYFLPLIEVMVTRYFTISCTDQPRINPGKKLVQDLNKMFEGNKPNPEDPMPGGSHRRNYAVEFINPPKAKKEFEVLGITEEDLKKSK
jgi:hypothetical protein